MYRKRTPDLCMRTKKDSETLENGKCFTKAAFVLHCKGECFAWSKILVNNWNVWLAAIRNYRISGEDCRAIMDIWGRRLPGFLQISPDHCCHSFQILSTTSWWSRPRTPHNSYFSQNHWYYQFWLDRPQLLTGGPSGPLTSSFKPFGKSKKYPTRPAPQKILPGPKKTPPAPIFVPSQPQK